MANRLRKMFVSKFRANGLSDCLYAQEGDENSQLGACISLQNLVPDRHTRGIYAPRPAYSSAFNAASAPGTAGGTGITTQGFVVCAVVLGSRVYGMCTGNNGATYYDMPFCYDFSTGAFVTITGFTNANCPLDTGYPNGAGAGSVGADWVSPQMQLVGSKIIVTHYGFTAPNYIGWIDISTPAAPTWTAGNLSGAGGLSFTVPPVAVTQFNGRAYYAVGGTVSSNNVIYSDSLNPTVCTNATQVLTVGDNQKITGFGQQPYSSATVGGIIQSILAYKQSSIAQITGDPVTSNLLVNVIASGVGCQSPQTIASTPLGNMFLAADGIRYIDLYGKVSKPLPSLRNPFSNCNLISSLCFPTTACAAYNSNIYRISLYTTDLIGNVYRQEYAFDLEFLWSGPHLYDAAPTQTGIAVIQPYAAKFLIVNRAYLPLSVTANNSLVSLSSLIPGPADAFVESGSTLTWLQLSSGQDDDKPMVVKSIKQATIAYNPGNTNGAITVSANPTAVGVAPATNQPPTQSATLSYTPPGALWGTAIWGAFQWGGSSLTNMDETTVTFPDSIYYKNVQFQVSGTAALNQRLGPISYRGTVPPYTNQDVA